MKKILLLSGGFDSLLISQMKEKSIDYYVYIDYGHRFKQRELEVIEKMKITHGIEVETIQLPNLRDKNGFFYGRNLRFFIAIREHFLEENIAVYFGHNADDNYNDNTRYFLQDVERVINNSYPSKTLRIICPLENMTKQEIIEQYTKTSLYKDVLPYFCDTGEKELCKKCHSCLAMIEAGLL